MATASRPLVTERDREYMRKHGRYKAESHADALANHLRLSANERLVESIAFARSSYSLPGWDHRQDDAPERFYELAKRLGFYRP